MSAWSPLPPGEGWGEGEQGKTFGFSKKLLLMPNLFKKAFPLLAIFVIGFSCCWPTSADEPKPAKSKSNSVKTKEWHWPKVTISKETTYFTEPLRPDGGIDYVAAFNQRYSRGVTPENNAAVALLQAIGPKDIDKRFRKRYFEMLSIPELPETGDYLVDDEILPEYEKAKKPLTPEEALSQKLWNQYDAAKQTPWSKKDYPLLATVLERNEKPLQVFAEGMKRPQFYSPLIPSFSGNEIPPLVACINPLHSKMRLAMRLLAIRATLRLHDGDVSSAWQDIMAMYRFGRMESQPSQSIGFSCFMAWEGQGDANKATMQLSQHAGLTAAQARECCRQLQSLPAMHPFWKSCDESDRCCEIESIMELANSKSAEASGFAGGGEIPEAEKTKQLRHVRALNCLVIRKGVDWSEVLQRYNVWYDRLVDVNKSLTYVQAFAKHTALVAETKQQTDRITQSVLSGKTQIGGDMTAKEHAQTIANLAFGMIYSLDDQILGFNCKCYGQTEENMALITLALAGYRADHQGTYPKTLAELMPAYIDTLPKDLFTGDNLRYQNENGGYRLYSVGRNGKDDGGRNFNDKCDAMGGHSTSKEAEAWDDIVFCTPLKRAEQEPNKAK